MTIDPNDWHRMDDTRPVGTLPTVNMIRVEWCDSCRRIHAKELACNVVQARLEASIIQVGELLGEEEIGDCDRVELLRELRMRGISLEPEGNRWRAVETVAA